MRACLRFDDLLHRDLVPVLFSQLALTPVEGAATGVHGIIGHILALRVTPVTRATGTRVTSANVLPPEVGWKVIGDFRPKWAVSFVTAIVHTVVDQHERDRPAVE